MKNWIKLKDTLINLDQIVKIDFGHKLDDTLYFMYSTTEAEETSHQIDISFDSHEEAQQYMDWLQTEVLEADEFIDEEELEAIE